MSFLLINYDFTSVCIWWHPSLLPVPWKYNINHDIPSRDGFPNQLSNVSLWIIISTRISPFVVIPVYLKVYSLLSYFSAIIPLQRWVLPKGFCGTNLYVWKNQRNEKFSTSRWAAVFWTLMYWSAGPGFCNNRWPPFALIASICTRRPPLAVFLLFAFIFVHNCKDYFFY